MLQEAHERSFVTPETPSWPVAPRVDNQRTVRDCLKHLLNLSERPAARSTRVVALSEPILDVWYNVKGKRAGREGVAEELVVDAAPKFNLGGGANVVRGLAEFAGDVTLITRIGTQPPYTHEMADLLRGLPQNVNVTAVADASTMNAVKTRYTTPEGYVSQCVNYQPQPVLPAVEQQLIDHLAKANLRKGEKVVVSDYGRGMCSQDVMQQGIHSITELNPDIRVIIDPRPNGHLDKYNITGSVLTPNRDEAEQLSDKKISGDSPREVRNSAIENGEVILARFPAIAGVLQTMDSYGSMYVGRDGSHSHVPATVRQRDVINPSGAGDTVVASLALLEDEFGMNAAVRTAMWIAGTAVTEPGTSTLSPQIVRKTLLRLGR